MIQVGDMVKKATISSLYNGVGVVVRVIEHDEHTGNLYDMYVVEWLQISGQYPYSETELTLVSRA